MNSEEIRSFLEVEQAKGETYKRIWDSVVGPFFIRKENELIEAFRGTRSNDTDALVMIRMQFNAIEALKVEFQHFITTGQIAQKQLFEEENKNG